MVFLTWLLVFQHPIHRWPVSAHVALAMLTSVLIAGVAYAIVDRQVQRGERLHGEIEEAAHLVSLSKAPDTVKPAVAVATDQHWPQRAQTDDVVRVAGELAQSRGVVVHSLSVSHQATTAQNWGRTTLDVSASGPYNAIKEWQAGLQNEFAAIAVRSLRLQSGPSGMGGSVDAQFTWMLYVRD